jgi:RimJ/RimL family protein N-acetyltransferase
VPKGRTLTLVDGARVLVRPIEPGDRARLVEALERLSDQTRYRRFLAHRRAFSHAELDYLTDVDHRDHEALLAVDVSSGAAVGVARYVRMAPRTAEIAVTVIDDWQERGVGGHLLELLTRRARRAGIEHFVAFTVAGNEPALRLLNRLPHGTRRGADMHVELGARVGRRPRVRLRRRRQSVSTVQALTPGAP